MMLAFVYLKIFTVFSSIPFIVGNDIQKQVAAAELEKIAGDGEQFINKIYNGQKMSENPGVLMFTAPYKLCEGGCNGSDNVNFAMQFPLFIGRKGQEAYKRVFHRDFEVLHLTKRIAPFKKRTTAVSTTQSPCIILKLNLIPRTETTTTTTTTTSTTTTTTTTTTEATTQTSTVGCPYFPPGVCFKKKKHITTHTTAEIEKDLTLSPELITEQPTTQGTVEHTVDNKEVKLGEVRDDGIAEIMVLRNKKDNDYFEEYSDGYNLYNYGYPQIKNEENM